ncbi:MAG: hypothetical protein ACYTHN_19645 [Planctomycetota bacterium]|jgi:hypothetical protein
MPADADLETIWEFIKTCAREAGGVAVWVTRDGFRLYPTGEAKSEGGHFFLNDLRIHGCSDPKAKIPDLHDPESKAQIVRIFETCLRFGGNCERCG